MHIGATDSGIQYHRRLRSSDSPQGKLMMREFGYEVTYKRKRVQGAGIEEINLQRDTYIAGGAKGTPKKIKWTSMLFNGDNVSPHPATRVCLKSSPVRPDSRLHTAQRTSALATHLDPARRQRSAHARLASRVQTPPAPQSACPPTQRVRLDVPCRNKEDENESRSGSDNLEGGFGNDLDENPRKKKCYLAILINLNLNPTRPKHGSTRPDTLTRVSEEQASIECGPWGRARVRPQRDEDEGEGKIANELAGAGPGMRGVRDCQHEREGLGRGRLQARCEHGMVQAGLQEARGCTWRYGNMEKTKLFEAPTEPEAPLVSKRGGRISSYTSRKSYALEEACTVWEGVLIEKKEESTSTNMPLGTAIHNIEITLRKGGQLARAAGAVAKLIAKEGKSATLRLPSGEVRLISKNCLATVGQVGNVGVNQKSLGRAGSKCWLGKCPVVRGVVMNPVDHPHGGGEGRAPIGRKKPTTPWGYPALGRRSRKRNKYSDSFILRHPGRIEKLNMREEKEIIVTWSRASTIIPTMIGHTIAKKECREGIYFVFLRYRIRYIRTSLQKKRKGRIRIEPRLGEEYNDFVGRKCHHLRRIINHCAVKLALQEIHGSLAKISTDYRLEVFDTITDGWTECRIVVRNSARNLEKEESAFATRLFLDHRRTFTWEPTDAGLLPNCRLTPDLWPTAN
ncbi:hypothetical protein IEQ34_011439 [Dendrobium chrysotoxum]|uniref:Large ribosomal subunit protein uL2m n=1 Tax=Dendrobium chrysotoxum TaxID=161865 RepID=A0AAV7GA78_DENCH|nr:hypothetical protein IEQ34_011439 [Dendrobium chrysotoxum]